MKKITIILIGLFFVWVQHGMAQKMTVYGESDPEAKAILDAASKKFKTYSGVKADFTLVMTTTDGKDLGKKEGTIWLKKDKYRLAFTHQEVYCDGTTVWTYNKSLKEVQVVDYEPEDDAITPATLFTDFYDKDFLYRVGGSSTVNGKAVHVIEMTPFDKSKPYFKIMTLIGKENKSLMGMEIFEKGGQRYTYTVDKFIPNIELNDSDFVFDKKSHPGVEVVDLR